MPTFVHDSFYWCYVRVAHCHCIGRPMNSFLLSSHSEKHARCETWRSFAVSCLCPSTNADRRPEDVISNASPMYLAGASRLRTHLPRGSTRLPEVPGETQAPRRRGASPPALLLLHRRPVRHSRLRRKAMFHLQGALGLRELRSAD